MKKNMIMAMMAALILGLGTGIMAEAAGHVGHAGKHNGSKAKNCVTKDNTKGTADSEKKTEASTKNKTDAKKATTDATKAKVDSNTETRRENYVDTRQNNQGRRIQHGINKGYLTPAETQSLQSEQQKIAGMESSYKSDGKLSRDEMTSLRGELDVASDNIWAEKHDTDGKQMPTYRLGKNVFAKDSFTSQMANQNMTGADAKALTGDFRKMLGLKNSLANDNLSDTERAQKQAEYDSLLNQYFEVR